MKHVVMALALAATLSGCTSGSADPATPSSPYDAFLMRYAAEVTPAWTRWRDAEWRTHTAVVPGDTTKAEQAVTAAEQWRALAADAKWVRESRELMRTTEAVQPPTPAEKAGIDAVGRFTRLYPATDADLIRKIADKEGLQARFRRRSMPTLDGVPVHPDELARRYAATIDTAERKLLWKAALSPPSDLKPGFAELRDLRNELARKGGWSNYMDAQADVYGMSADELANLMSEVEIALRPLYQELHTWARSELARRYDVPPPDLIPAHWLPSPLGDDWSGLLRVDHLDVEPALQQVGAKQMLRGVEDWYVSVGVPALPQTVWDNSSFYPPAPDARVGKTQGAATWDVDLHGDIRVLLNARPTSSWMSASYRELGFAHAYALRDGADIPDAVRMQPPHAVLGALGLWADLAASRPTHLQAQGILDQAPDPMQALLLEALSWVPYVQFGVGAVVPFEYEVYAEGLAPGQMNSRWWGLLARHQGLYPPETRTERWGDFLAVDALSDAPGRYIDDVVAVLLAFQLHESVCNEVGVDPRTADITGQARFGERFTQVALGAGVQDWRALTQASTGAAPSADAMVRYFQPLYLWLQEQNAGKPPTLPSVR
ncbi:MAG: M2 family metallopeptidase [Alphaproteobacteria bacterium]|nr:M2 family metallopeptidase [Alphaproteobacteria bacterium]